MEARVLSLLIAVSILKAASHAIPAQADGSTSALERQARTIDRAGRKSMLHAIQGIEKLISSKPVRGDDTADRLLRLIDLRDELVQVNFRISAAAEGPAKTAELKSWQDSLKALDRSCTQFLEQHTQSSERHRIRLLRAKTLEELQLKQRARSDYEQILADLREGPLFSAAILALATLEASENRHDRAVSALRRLDGTTSDSRWLLSRFKLVWSLHNLSRTSDIQSVYHSVLEQSTTWDAQDEPGAQASDTSLRDALWLDLAVFAAEAIDQGDGFGNLRSLDALFRNLTPDARRGMVDLRSRMQLRLGKLLRSQKREGELNEWIDLSTATERDRSAADTPRLIQVAIEFLLQPTAGVTPAQALTRQEQAIRWIKRLAGHAEFLTPAMEEIRQFLGDVQVGLLSGIKESKQDIRFVERLSQELTTILPEGDARRIDIRMNLAESLFKAEHFEQSETHYEAALAAAIKLEAKPRITDLFNRRLGARVAALKKDGSIPATLKALSLQNVIESKDSTAAIARIREARTWQAQDSGLRLDLIRGLYHSGEVREALAALEEELLLDSRSESATAASALVLDTWIASHDWVKTAEAARRHLDLFSESEKNRSHLAHLRKIEAQASLRLLIARFDSLDARENPEIQRLLASSIQQWIDTHADSEEQSKARGILARSICLNSAIAESQCDKAISDWQNFLRKSGGIQDPSPLLLRSEISLARWKWEEAQRDLKEALALLKKGGPKSPSQSSAEDVEKTVSRIQSLLEGRSVSAEETLAGQALKTLNEEVLGEKTYRKRLKALRTLAREWKNLTEQERLPLMKPMARIIAEKLPLLRADIKKVAPLIASPKWIQWRIDAIREFESHLTSAGEGLPFAGIRVAALTEIALASQDLETDIGAIKFSRDTPPADREEVRAALAPLREGMKSKVAALIEQSRALSRETGLQVEPNELPDWSRIVLPQGLPAELAALLRKITESGNLPGTSAILEQARAKKIIDDSLAIRIYAISLLKAGYQAESIKSWRNES